MGFLFRRATFRLRTGPSVENLLRARGAARSTIAVDLIQHLCATPAAIPATWERIELPLVHDLPDCPPATKPALIAALEDCATACRHRDTARRMMVVRDSLRL